MSRASKAPASTREKTGYIPTLDGWRAVAITCVLFAHSSKGAVPWLGHGVNTFLAAQGHHGVDLFFAISGLLICSRLLEEEKRSGGISLRGFYVRRAFRILPPAVLYLVAIAVLSLAGLFMTSKLDWFASLLFFRNYTIAIAQAPTQDWFTAHFWSLSVEEHFYIVLPGLLVVMRRWRLTALGTVIVLVEAGKLLLIHRIHVDMGVFGKQTEICVDEILIPAFLAIWIRRGSHEEWMRRLLPAWSVYLLLPVCVRLVWHANLSSLTACVVPLLLLSTVYHPHRFVGRLLESRALRWIGRLSYSLYLWQQLFLCHRYLKYEPLGILERPPVNLLLVFACAVASFYLIERPAIRLGHDMAKPATRRHRDVVVMGVQTEAL